MGLWNSSNCIIGLFASILPVFILTDNFVFVLVTVLSCAKVTLWSHKVGKKTRKTKVNTTVVKKRKKRKLP